MSRWGKIGKVGEKGRETDEERNGKYLKKKNALNEKRPKKN